MRKTFADELVKQAKKNNAIWLITADLGYGIFDEFKRLFPMRFINTGAAEQSASDICVGLALSKKIPFFYSITPFLLYRCFETWRTYVNYEKIPVKLVGSGRDRDYLELGFSHWAEDDFEVINMLNHIHGLWPEDKKEIKDMVEEMVCTEFPYYLNLKKDD